MSILKYMFNLDQDRAKEFFKLTRTRLGLNQREMAKKMKMTTISYQRFENQKGLPEVGKVTRFIEATGVAWDEFNNYTKYGIINNNKPKYSNQDDDINEIVAALATDKVLLRIVLQLIRHMHALENINK